MSRPATYVPRADSLAAAVIDFLERHPGVYLEPADVVARFDVTHTGSVISRLGDAVRAGLLRREWRQGCSRKVYLLGAAATHNPNPSE